MSYPAALKMTMILGKCDTFGMDVVVVKWGSVPSEIAYLVYEHTDIAIWIYSYSRPDLMSVLH